MERASGDHPVAIELRREVNFRCPIPGCGYPILTYHHFDPPWNVREHNDPEGMIALCHVCHDKADGRRTGSSVEPGLWTTEQLRSFKRNPSNHLPKRHNLLWLEPNVKPLFRIGGVYLLDTRSLVSGDEPILWQNQAGDGTTLFSFDLKGPDGNVLLAVRENSLSIEDFRLWDFHFNTRGNHLIARPARGRIALDLHLKRCSLTRVAEAMKADSMKTVPSQIAQRCVNSDGDILLIDFRTAELYVRPDELLLVRSGTVYGGRDGTIRVMSGFVCDGGIGFQVW